MSASPEAIRAIRTVALKLGDLLDRVVFVGGAVRSLLVTDPAVEGSRATKDVDVVAAGITTRVEYYAVADRLRERGFSEDTSDGAPLCRWKVSGIIVDVMPPEPAVLGFTNRWYQRTIEKARVVAIPDDTEPRVDIRLVTAPYFVATKLEAFGGRGGGDYEASHDIEDVIAVIDGRPSVVTEIEEEPLDLRSFIAAELSRHLAAGLDQAIAGHLAGDAASQARRPFVECALDRLRRLPHVVRGGETVESKTEGDPGATGQAHRGPWRYEVLETTRRPGTASRDHVVVRARLTNLGRVAGTVGDGRNIHIEDARGRRFPPLRRRSLAELARLGLPPDDEQVAPEEPFETCWVYEVPREARALRLLLPFGRCELPLADPV